MRARQKFWKYFSQIAQRAFPTPQLFEALLEQKSQRYKEIWYITHQDKQWGDLNPANSDHQDWFAWWNLCLQNFFDELKHLKGPYGHLADKDRTRVILDQFPKYDRMFVNPMVLTQDILRAVGPANKALRVEKNLTTRKRSTRCKFFFQSVLKHIILTQFSSKFVF